MTLFRKVFQNQARPASPEETMGDDALRAAFSAVEEGASPFVLDPHEHSVSKDLEEDVEEKSLALDESEVAADPATPDAEVADLIDTLNPPDEDNETSPQHDDTQVTVSQDTPATEISSGPETDEEIAAFMNRALTAEPEDQDEDMQEIEPAAPVDELEFTQPGQDEIADDDTSDPDLDAALNEEVTEQPEEQAKPELRLRKAPLSEATAPSDDDADEKQDVDLKAFAKQQLDELSHTEILTQAPKEENSLVPEASAEIPDASGEATALDLSGGASGHAVPAPAAGRAGRRAGRVKTRLLGFNHDDDDKDPLGQVAESTATPQREKFPVGWLVVVEGPGVGHAFSIFTGASMIGRGDDQVIRLDFGDNSISRHNHAAIAYDEEANKFYVGHGGKSNIIRRNARPVLSTEELHHADLLRIGETTLRFVALCGSDFQWTGANDAVGL